MKGLQDCSKTFKMSIWNFKTSHYTVSWISRSGYDCRFSAREIPFRNLWIANVRFSFYEIWVRNQLGHKTLRSYLKTPALVVQAQLQLIRIEYVFAFQMWYCEPCLKKPIKGRQKALLSFLFFLPFSQLKFYWKFELISFPFSLSKVSSLLCHFF